MGKEDFQECFYGAIQGKAGEAVRSCRVRNTWGDTGETFTGARNECITFSTYRLRQLDRVSCCGLQFPDVAIHVAFIRGTSQLKMLQE